MIGEAPAGPLRARRSAGLAAYFHRILTLADGILEQRHVPRGKIDSFPVKGLFDAQRQR